MLFALMAHAGINVLNDYFDALSGCDAANSERLYPFTGGSRFIQNGVLSAQATGAFGYTLLALVAVAGLWLSAHCGPTLLAVGLAGLLVGWVYSAPPLQLVNRGMGELAVTCGWLLIMIGTDFVQRHALHVAPIASGMAYALLVANLLFINQFPDAKADARAGKRTLVVRLGVQRARWGYGLLAGLGALWVAGCVAVGALPPLALLSLLSLAASAAAFRELWGGAARPATLAPAIKLTILAALGHGLLMCAALLRQPG